MHELDDYGTFTDAGGHALYRAAADIAHHENSRDIGLQQTGVAIQRPRSGPFAIAKEFRAGKDEAALIALDQLSEPLRAGLCADENKKARSRQLLACPGRIALHSDACESCVTLNFDHAGLRPDLDF